MCTKNYLNQHSKCLIHRKEMFITLDGIYGDISWNISFQTMWSAGIRNTYHLNSWADGKANSLHVWPDYTKLHSILTNCNDIVWHISMKINKKKLWYDLFSEQRNNEIIVLYKRQSKSSVFGRCFKFICCEYKIKMLSITQRLLCLVD